MNLSIYLFKRLSVVGQRCYCNLKILLKETPRRYWNRYRDQLCCFNDDIQGTAAVSVGALIAACHNKGQKLSQQKIAFLGAGSAGCGIAEHIIRQMQREGLTEEQARSQVFMVDRYGFAYR